MAERLLSGRDVGRDASGSAGIGNDDNIAMAFARTSAALRRQLRTDKDLLYAISDGR